MEIRTNAPGPRPPTPPRPKAPPNRDVLEGDPLPPLNWYGHPASEPPEPPPAPPPQGKEGTRELTETPIAPMLAAITAAAKGLGDGMTLRDRFAAMVDPGPILDKVAHTADRTQWEVFMDDSHFGYDVQGRVKWEAMVHARIRYMLADAMLKERERGG